MKLPSFNQLPVIVRRLLNPWSRVPPSYGAAYVPRVLGKLYENQKVDEINQRYPPRVHDHVVSPYSRPFERGAGERISAKWKAKPYEYTYVSKTDANKDPLTEEFNKRTGGNYGIIFHNLEHVLRDKFPKRGFPLLDYDYPLPAGRILMKWLYDRQRETFCFQRGILPVTGARPVQFIESWRAPSAILIGDVYLGNFASVYDGCVLKGDRNTIHLDIDVHILENSVVSTAPPTPGGNPRMGSVIIGEKTTIGPNCRLHACEIGIMCSIGSGTTIRYGAKVGDGCVIAAGSVVEEDQFIPSNEIWGGAPAKFIRATGPGDKWQTLAEADDVSGLAEDYEFNETVHGNVWVEVDQVVEAAGDVLREKIKGKIDTALPPSLMMALLEGVSAEEHPNPSKSLAQSVREMFKDDYDFNRVSELRPMWTGNYTTPDMPNARY